MKKGTRLKIGELSGWGISSLLILPTILMVAVGNGWLIHLAFQHHEEVWRDADRTGVERSMELVARQIQDEIGTGQEADADVEEFLETVRRTSGYAYVKVLRPDGKPWSVASRDMASARPGEGLTGPARSGKVMISERDEGSSRVETYSISIDSRAAGPVGSVEIGHIVQARQPSRSLVLEWALVAFGPLLVAILWLNVLCLRMQRELTQLGRDLAVITTTGNFDHVLHDIGWMPKELVSIRTALGELVGFGQRIQLATTALENQDLNSEDLRKPLAGSTGQALKNICWDFVQLREKLSALANGDLYDLRLDESVRGVIGQNQLQMLEYLRRIHSQLQIMARGDLDDANLQKRLAGDLGLVLKILLRKVKGVVDVARKSTTSLTEVGSRMKVMADQQSSAAMSQASSVSEATATLTQLATSAGQIAESTNHVLKMAEQTLKSARSGRGAVEEVVRGIEEIRRYNEENTRQVHQLLQTSEKIAEVLEVINGIAGQTRLLSLNAAIEAARAGEAGKGFSIVAVEVRKLADSVVESTGQIQGLVEGIRSLTSSIVESAVQGEAKVREGVNLARKAGGSLTEIDALADQTAQFAHQISISTRQQKVGTEQTVEEIKGLTLACSRMEEGARAYADVSEELEALGGRVRDQLVEFSSQTGRLLSSRDSQPA